MAQLIRKEDALEYHSKGRPGKIEVIPTKETKTQRDLALAYSPGVAEPCLDIAANPDDVYKYTAKGNLVAVISNGTAVLGLGDIGPEASKPVMEGKGLLFKIYADIDVFDIELNVKDPEAFIQVVKALEPTFGGINLEDIKAPECFEIETRLKAELKIPIMHDDQHGTAIISGAALLNALDIVGKNIADVKIVISGAGASAISCCKIYLALGARVENMYMFDSKGLIIKTRTDLDSHKTQFAQSCGDMSLEDAMKGADVFIGLSKGGVVSQQMVKGMGTKPIVFALANPNPEITYDDALAARPDVIMATGRSDYPNQVNNVLGFPYIFRGALDVRASAINEEMKLAAVHALAALAKEPVPDLVNVAYNDITLQYGPTYIIPKPMDPRLLVTVSMAVAKAAIDSGVARLPITDWETYENQLYKRLGSDDIILRHVINKAKQTLKRVVFSEAENIKILKAAQLAKDEGIAIPILLGNEAKIRKMIAENNIHLDDVEIIDPKSDAEDANRNAYGELFFEQRKRRGINLYEAKKIMRERPYYGCMMVKQGRADALVSGLTRKYPYTIRPALEIIGMEEGAGRVAGLYIMLTKKGPLFFADTTLNFNPTEDQLVDITLLTAKAVEHFNIKPRIAMLSYSNFGSTTSPEALTVSNAVAKIKARHPDLIIDGEVQASVAFNKELLKENYPFSDLVNESPNVLIFPNLAAGNIAYHLLQEVGGAEAVGPILLGLKKPVYVLQLGSTVRQIVNIVAIAAMEAQVKS
ncbi:NADP-dependent malic enzyme [Flavipsychrobacter stenotrophus]|uniref:NADP-dependent malic enzyme n=1 Tax=Flavipsychrobacter stenotrophus TaxID=2077091 RepID=A0A2S7SX81_9BACT|nr:NADP-dependent malic enzyme [Flavipsychrobacter stenotrophus]PQJ11344.1 NADP-dependent malic enzyme [Flavipsychrobacter stenotrophus]